MADADAEARSDLAALLARIGCEPVEVANGKAALEAAMVEQPALVVLDVGLTDVSAYECCRTLRERHGEGLPIVLVSSDRLEPADQVAGLMLGADEYLAKPIHADLFTARMRRLLLRAQARAASGRSPLTPRESEVLGLLVAGMSAREIAEQLCITEKTTATHIERILAKLGAHSRAQAVAFAVRDHLVEAAA